MLNKKALVALAAFITALPTTFAAETKSTKPPLAVYGYPTCKVYNTEDVLSVSEFEASEGGGTKVFLDIFEPDIGCSVVVRSPASTDIVGCGFVVGSFKNAACQAVSLKETFIVQHCCGSADCEKVGGLKAVRGIDYKRGLPTNDAEVKWDGRVIEPAQVGEPPKKTARRDDTLKLFRRGDDCKDYIPDGEVYTRPADDTQVVATGVDGGTTGSEVTITTERTVSQSVTFSAGFNIEIISASTDISNISFPMQRTFEESISNGKEKKWTIPAGQNGKVGFTPTLKCTKGSMQCKDGTSEGEACTGFQEADEIAGTYAVIATS
ncbi:MAG: hypothetical protein Q9181_005863 [Wetmoreana brouardii]